MLLVIFGAGASFDSAPSYQPPLGGDPGHPNRPPLADQLFDDRPTFRAYFQRFPECLPLITNLRHRAQNVTVEQELERMSGEIAAHPARHAQLMAVRYALHLLLYQCVQGWSGVHAGVTNYGTLMDHIARWRSNYKRVVVVTFNYDTMIEDAFEVVGVKISSMSDYVRDSRYQLVKIHGSVNWARDIAEPLNLNPNDPRILINEAGRIRTSDTWWMVDQYPVSSVPLPDQRRRIAAVPAIALPLLSKSSFECPPEHLQALEDALPHVSKVLVMGWRAMEPNFNALLKKHIYNQLWHIVAGSRQAGEDAVRHLTAAGIAGKFSISDGGFSSFVINRESYGFLQGK